VFDADAQHRSWSVRSTAYFCDLVDRDQREILAYHWHPATDGPSFPQFHLTGRLPAIGVGPGVTPVALGDMHLPTGHVSFASVVRLLIEEFGIAPRRSDWQAILERGDPADDEN